MATQAATFNASTTLTKNTFATPGYTFSGWNTAANGSGTKYTDAQTFTYSAAGNTTLYAQWTPIVYQVIYDANSTFATGTMPNQNATFNANLTFAKNAFTRPGYTFSGWNTKTDGTGAGYTDAASINPYATVGNTTLYAQWTPFTATAQNPDGTTTTIKENADGTITAPAAPTKNGSTFNYWYLCSDASQAEFVFAKPLVADVELCAKFTANPVAVKPLPEQNAPAAPNTSFANFARNPFVILFLGGIVSGVIMFAQRRKLSRK